MAASTSITTTVSLAKATAAQGYDASSPTFRSVTPAMITDAHERGLPVIPWTVNTTPDMERLMDLGVDGIITDYPPACARSWRNAG